MSIEKIDGYIQIDPVPLPIDGWIVINDNRAWTPNSSSQFEGDLDYDYTPYFKTGTLVRWENSFGILAYGVCTSASFGTKTIVNLVPNTDYDALDGVENVRVSPILYPEGFPVDFNWNANPQNFAGTYVAKWYPLGPGKIKWEAEFSMTGALTGTFSFSLPVINRRATNNPVLGVGYCLDTGNASYPAQALGAYASAVVNPIVMRYDPTLGTATQYIKQEFMNATKPFTWGNGDAAQFTGDYEY